MTILTSLRPRAATGRARRRRGAAPVEFVMQLPFLVGLAAMIITVGNSSLKRNQAAIKARREVWSLRDNLDQANSDLDYRESTGNDTPLGWGLDLSISGGSGDNLNASNQDSSNAGIFDNAFNPEMGGVYGETSEEVSVMPWLGGNREARSAAAVLGTSWDHNDLPEFMERGPHFQPMERAATGTTVVTPILEKIVQLLLGNIRDAFGTLDEDFQDELSDAEDAQADAEEQAAEEQQKAEEEKQKLQDEIDEAKEEKEQLEEDKQDLQDEKQDLEDEKAAKEEQLEELQNQDPPPEGEIEALEDEIDSLDDQIDDKQDEINDKQQEINDKQDEIDELEGHMEDAENQIGDAQGQGSQAQNGDIDAGELEDILEDL